MSEGSPQAVGSYRLYEKIGGGGMGTVHLGRRFATGGFRRIVAIKRLHPHLAEDADFVTAFLDEARLASRVHHPNVVAPLDVVAQDGEVFLVFEHVLGLSLAALVRCAMARDQPVPPRIAAALMVNVLHGLHEAHEAAGDDGRVLGLVHRDVSPQNVLVGKDGSARLLDFGIAKASGRSQVTDEGVVKGKRGYMAPEQLLGRTSRASDIYSAAVVLWELLTGMALFPPEVAIEDRISGMEIDPPSHMRTLERIGDQLDALVLRGLARDPADRFPTARDMAIALEEVGVATAREVGDWVVDVGREGLDERARLVALVESYGDTGEPSSRVLVSTTTGESQLGDTQATESFPPAALGRRPRRRIIAGAIALFVFLATAAVLVLVFARTDRNRGPAPALAAVEPEPPPAEVASGEAPSTGSAASPESSAPKPRAQIRSRAPKKACKPYFTDKDGRRQFNEACLH